MAFAIFYNDEDLPFLEAARGQNVVISSADKNLLTKVWNGGLKNWRSAPIAQSPFEQVIPTNTARMVVVTSTVSLADFRAALYRLAAANPLIGPPGEEGYLKALADDMGRNCGAVEPWP